MNNGNGRPGGNAHFDFTSRLRDLVPDLSKLTPNAAGEGWYELGRGRGKDIGDADAGRRLIDSYFDALVDMARRMSDGYATEALRQAGDVSRLRARQTQLEAELDETDEASWISKRLRDCESLETDLQRLRREGTGDALGEFEEQRRRIHRQYALAIGQLDIEMASQVTADIRGINDSAASLEKLHGTFVASSDRIYASLEELSGDALKEATERLKALRDQYEATHKVRAESLSKLTEAIDKHAKEKWESITNKFDQVDARRDEGERELAAYVNNAAMERVPKGPLFNRLLGAGIVLCVLIEFVVANQFTATALDMTSISNLIQGRSQLFWLDSVWQFFAVFILSFIPFVLSWGVKGLFEPWSYATAGPGVVAFLGVVYLKQLQKVPFLNTSHQSALVALTATCIVAGGYLLHRLLDEHSLTKRVTGGRIQAANSVSQELTRVRSLIDARVAELRKVEEEIETQVNICNVTAASMTSLKDLANGRTSAHASAARAAYDLGFSAGIGSRAGIPERPERPLTAREGSEVWRTLQVLQGYWPDGAYIPPEPPAPPAGQGNGTRPSTAGETNGGESTTTERTADDIDPDEKDPNETDPDGERLG